MSNNLTVYVNGKCHSLTDDKVDPKCTLLQFLRSIGLTGTKLGCGEGGCGACTVMISSFDRNTQAVVHYSANACLTPVCSVDGCAVTTVEGIGGMKHGLHPVQKRVSSMHGSQCGFCTPGIIMAIYTQLRSHPDSTPEEIEEALDGNLCRCTGYRPIIDAARSLSNNKGANTCCGGGSSKGCPCFDSKSEGVDETKTTHNCSGKAIHSHDGVNAELTARGLTEPIFPPALTRYEPSFLKFNKSAVHWYQPVTMEELLDLKAQYPNARLIVGNTEVGIETRFKALEYSCFINPSHIPELKTLSIVNHQGIQVGASVTINKLKQFCHGVHEQFTSQGKGYMTRGLLAIHDMLAWFASNHIRNVACVGGNIATASPISDLNPMLLATDAVLTVRSKTGGERKVPMSQFFLSYRKVDLKPDEIIEHVFIPFTNHEFEFILPYKQARRREDDISIVTSGIRVRLKPDSAKNHWIIDECNLAYGGMAPITLLAKATAESLVHQSWDFKTIESAFHVLRKELSLPENVPGGQSEYRMSLTISFLFKAYLTITTQLSEYLSKLPSGSTVYPAVPFIDSADKSGTSNFLSEEKPVTQGSQSYYNREGGIQLTTPVPHAEAADQTADVVGKPLMHKSAEAQVCGDARYTDDIPLPPGALHGCLVTSQRAHARIINVDTSAAEKCEGYVAYVSAKDIPGTNHVGPIFHDEEVFVSSIVKHFNAIIGVIIAETHEQAVYAARKVKIEYEDLPAIVSIEDAIAAHSYYEIHHVLKCGDMSAEQAQADYHVEGTIKTGSQEHFYLETNCAVVLPLDNGHFEIHSSCQNLNETQVLCAKVCGIPASKIAAKCKRLGGGFGGKESRAVPFACVAATAAYVLNKPISLNIERDVDMTISGQRHAFMFTYKAGMSKDGKLRYMDADLYSNAGFSYDLSVPVMDRALFHCDNVYKFPAIHLRGNVCRTNQPSHTAFRGFGAPQGFVLAETVMEHLSKVSNIPIDELRTRNIYQEGQATHFGEKLEDFFVPELWTKIHSIAKVNERVKQIEDFNSKNRWKKRGICVLPTKYGINFTAKFMNQGGALVHVYTDGSVLVAHGGTEMGQGLYTKTIQCAAESFKIPHEMVIIAETATNTVPNASPTAGSMSTDLYCMAVMNACEQIADRLKPYREKMPDADWKQIVHTAYFDRVNLSAQGFYIVKNDRCGFNWDLKDCVDNSERGMPFNYFTQGVACTEVEIDCLTGDSRVLRADILMDLGKSINPAIDIGQIEGAFIQGYGWSTMEELIWGDKEHPWVRSGQLFTRGPGTYKIPAFNDVPIDMRVHLSDTHNKFAVHSSKAVGEPPFFLGCSAYFAIKNAVDYARKENGLNEYYRMDLPATSERIRMACSDHITKLCVSSNSNNNNNSVNFLAKGSF